MTLVKPTALRLSSFRVALDRGWLESGGRAGAAADVLATVEADATAFLASLDAREGRIPGVGIGLLATQPSESPRQASGYASAVSRLATGSNSSFWH